MLINNDKKDVTFNFHINRKARDKYVFDEDLFSIKGRVIFANFNASKRLALKINSVRKPGDLINPSELNAYALMDEIFHYLIETYRKKNPDLLEKISKRVSKEYGTTNEQKLVTNFTVHFPPIVVYKGKKSAQEYLQDKTDNFPNRLIQLEEMLVQWLHNNNPAYIKIKDLIDDQDLKKSTVYDDFFENIDDFFKQLPVFPDRDQSLLEVLLEPIKKHPGSIYDQLNFIKTNWAHIIGDLISRILIGLDFFKEDLIKNFDHAAFQNPDLFVPSFKDNIYAFELEKFSPDLDWMPSLVLLAKSTFVWLDQLSKKYQQPIQKLNQVPDEELNRLANFGFTGLWLIGIWERSRASQKIKQINGNPEAVASAYSLMDYEIAQDLGGEEAYLDLKERAWKRGIRLASDMVPNHMGIDSRWVRQHPDWFVQSDYPPFPNHSFNGPDLFDEGDYSIHIEDGYWNKSDAAVAFKIYEHSTGRTRYIYHGNDGTGMPWNDTAQLNYLIPEVREAVIQTILHVARKFPVIRFDAAMTLAKKHYQRLWFPEPGHGGDIPSRSEYAMTKDQFNQVFPVEFWREVVDRVAREVPDTLLLAEAFWMMEGYFVRTLGMHRVYNSAFMNMLKKEENAKFHEMVKNVLEFNPQILKRYVNFMNNPDEETAVAQFGKDDKYFGVCTLMCTMPGLPMFGHGQIEGYTEKYGMEYKKAYWDEQEDENLVNRHLREIVPLLKNRKLFSEVDRFRFYDLILADGSTDQNVFAYSNSYKNQSVLVFFNNKFQETSGWIKNSALFNDGNDNLIDESLSNALGLFDSDNHFTIFKDTVTQLEYLRSNKDLIYNGFFVHLGAFKYHVFIMEKQAESTEDQPYSRLFERLAGRGVESIDVALSELKILPVIAALENLLNDETFLILRNILLGIDEDDIEKLHNLLKHELTTVTDFYELPDKEKEITGFKKQLSALFTFKQTLMGLKKLSKQTKINILELNNENLLRTITPYFVIELIAKVSPFSKEATFENWHMHHLLKPLLSKDNLNLIQLFFTLNLPNQLFKKELDLKKVFSLQAAINYFQVNTYKDVTYINKEKWEHFLTVLFILVALEIIVKTKTKSQMVISINHLTELVEKLKNSAEESSYNLEMIIRKSEVKKKENKK